MQVEIGTQEEWSSFLGLSGLGGNCRPGHNVLGLAYICVCSAPAVVDVYSEWCGPCKAVLSLFRRTKNELGDDLLRFAVAKSDTIDSLEPYRHQSQPTFLFFAVSVPLSLVTKCSS